MTTYVRCECMWNRDTGKRLSGECPIHTTDRYISDPYLLHDQRR
jgi:hypothetical protein